MAISDRLDEASELLSKREFAKADAILRMLIQSGYDIPRLYFLMGQCQLALEGSSNGFDYLMRAIKLNPAELTYSSYVIKLLLNSQQFEKAKSLLKALQLAIGDSAELLGLKTKVLTAAGELKEAERCVETIAIQANQRDVAYYNYGNALRDYGFLGEACTQYEKALLANSGLIPAYRALAWVKEREGKFSEAFEYLKVILMKEPKSLGVYGDIAILLLKAKQYELGYKYCLDGLSNSGEDSRLGTLLLAHASGQKNFDLVISIANELLDTDSCNIHAKKYLGEALCKKGNKKDGLAVLKEAATSGLSGLLASFPSLVFFTDSDQMGCLRELTQSVRSHLDSFERKDSSLIVDLGFSVASVLHAQKDYISAYRYLKMANAAKPTDYSFEKQEAYFEVSSHYLKLPILEPKSDGKRKVVFVVGMPRSGTTLIEQILNAHSLVTGCGELEFAAMARRGVIDGHENELLFPDRIEAFRERYLAQLEKLEPGTDYVVDKMPNNFLHIGLLASAFPDALFIHCSRSDVETAFSIYRQNFQGHHAYAYDIPSLNHYAHCYKRHMQVAHKSLGSRIYLLPYEELVLDFNNRIKGLLTFCGLDYEAGCAEFYKEVRVVNTASGNQVNKQLYSSSLDVTQHYPEFVHEWEKLNA